MRLLLLFLVISSGATAQLRFDTGNSHRDKYWVGTAATLGGMALINYTDGPTEAIGAFWMAGGVANLVSGEIESEYLEYYPTDMKWKREILPVTSMFLAGALNGVNQDLLFHYHEFQNTFPNANPDFWDPSISWVNKYKNGDPLQGEAFPGSSTIFVAATDGYHATVAGRNLMITTAICLSPKTKGWKPFVKRTLLYSLSYGLGFELVYGKLIK
tara:strand:+ start:846 stop:1487 length:642 start_codon:yes stop_codon:yes gene_type:complete